MFILGSLLIFIGVVILCSSYLLKMRDEVYSDMKIAMSEEVINNDQEEITSNLPVGKGKVKDVATYYEIDYSKYLGVLEIPTIRLKRGFYGFNSRYNNIQYNVTLVNGSDYPDQINGNTILMAHSGDAYIAYFAYLYKLNIGNYAYVTYKGQKYTYQLVNKYNVPKIGVVNIKRNKYKTCLTLITCTKNSDTQQTIYILERI